MLARDLLLSVAALFVIVAGVDAYQFHKATWQATSGAVAPTKSQQRGSGHAVYYRPEVLLAPYTHARVAMAGGGRVTSFSSSSTEVVETKITGVSFWTTREARRPKVRCKTGAASEVR